MHNSPSRSGFTLIELLVVVSIIAVLASLLLPAISQARSMSQRTACSSNMRQIGMGLLAYADTWEDALPPSRRRLPGSTEITWDHHNVTQELYQMQNANTLSYRAPDGMRYARGVFRCPSTGLNAMGIWNSASEYGLNRELCRDLNWSTSAGPETITRLSGVVAPSETYLLADNARYQPNDSLKWRTTQSITPRFVAPSTSVNTGLHLRHRDGLNMLFVDFHVEYLPRDKLRTGETTGMSQTYLYARRPWAAQPLD